MKLEARSIISGYGDRAILHNLSLSVKSGDVVGILGANGSGKTTLFRSLMRFLPLMSGRLLIDGEDASSMHPSEFARKVSYIPQEHVSTFGYTVEEMVMMGRASHIGAFSVPGPADESRVQEALTLLGIADLRMRRYTELSGGQRRLVLICRAIAQEAGILIMDEPSSDLDYANQQLVQKTILDLAGRGYGIVLSTHAPEYPYAVASNVLLLKDGRTVAAGAPEKALTPASLSDAFGVPMDVVSVRDSAGRIRKMCIPL